MLIHSRAGYRKGGTHQPTSLLHHASHVPAHTVVDHCKKVKDNRVLDWQWYSACQVKNYKV